jgi:hypothetical protein
LLLLRTGGFPFGISTNEQTGVNRETEADGGNSASRTIRD